MDGNRDEAERCIEIAVNALREAKLDKAEKFLKKAENLYPTQKAKGELIDQLLSVDRMKNEIMTKFNCDVTEYPLKSCHHYCFIFLADILEKVLKAAKDNVTEEPNPSTTFRRRAASPKAKPEKVEPDFTNEQVEIVMKIKK